MAVISQNPLPVIRALARPLAAIKRVIDRRRVLSELSALDDHMLKDIGITRHDVFSAMAEPLYRDATANLARRASESRVMAWSA